MQKEEYDKEIEKLHKEHILSRNLLSLIMEQIGDGSTLARAGLNNMRIVKDIVYSDNEIEAEIKGFYLDGKNQESENMVINKNNFITFLNKVLVLEKWAIELILSDEEL